MFRTAVPEATINENRQLRFRKNKIRLPKHRLTPTPAFDPRSAEQSNQRKFSILVPMRTNTRHDLRPFRLREYIGHGAAFTKQRGKPLRNSDSAMLVVD